MLRLVKMEFAEGKADVFTSIYSEYSGRIAAAKGCKSVQLKRDLANRNIFFTISEWESEEFLDAYRKSELFKEVWTQVKPLFSVPAEAWSLL